MAFFTDTCLTDGPHNLSVLSLPSTPVTDVPAQDFTARDILTALQKPLFEGWTGRITVFPARCKIHVQYGRISAIEGHLPLGQLLVGRGHISETQLAQALSCKGPLGRTLVQDGLISEAQLADLLSLQVQQALDDLRRHPPTFYSFRPREALPGPHAHLTLADLKKLEQPATTDLPDDSILRLAAHQHPVNLSPADWELLRWFNGRRTLARAIEMSGLPPAQARAAARHLSQRGLLEPSAIAGLPLIVARLKPATEHRQPPASIRANLFLKHLNGETTMQHIVQRLNYPLEEAALMLTGLYRDGVLDLLRGEHEMQRLLEEY